MSDTLSYLHEKTVIAYPGTESGDLFVIVDVSDGNRIKVITREDLIKTILSGKKVGGTGSTDITTNSGNQTMYYKTLVNPVIVNTDGDATNDEMISTLIQMLKDLQAASITDGGKLVEATKNIPKQTFCAYFTDKATDPGGEIVIPVDKLFSESGVDSTDRNIDLRSCVINVLEAVEDGYSAAVGATALLVKKESLYLDQIIVGNLTPAAEYYISVHFRITEA